MHFLALVVVWSVRTFCALAITSMAVVIAVMAWEDWPKPFYAFITVVGILVVGGLVQWTYNRCKDILNR